MAAFAQQQGTCGCCVAPWTAHKCVAGAVYADIYPVGYAHSLPVFSAGGELVKFLEIGVIAQHMTHTGYSVAFFGEGGYRLAFGECRCQRFFQQQVRSGIQQQHGVGGMCAFGCRYNCGIRGYSRFKHLCCRRECQAAVAGNLHGFSQACGGGIGYGYNVCACFAKQGQVLAATVACAYDGYFQVALFHQWASSQLVPVPLDTVSGTFDV